MHRQYAKHLWKFWNELWTFSQILKNSDILLELGFLFRDCPFRILSALDFNIFQNMKSCCVFVSMLQTWTQGEDKVNFRPDTLQNCFLNKIGASRACAAPKTIWSCCTFIKIKLRWVYIYQHQIEPQ